MLFRSVQEWAARDDAERRRGERGKNDTGEDEDVDVSQTRSREAVTPVDARCARRAATAPKTMRSFFQTGTHTPEFDAVDRVENGSISLEPEPSKKRLKGVSEKRDTRLAKNNKNAGTRFFAPKGVGVAAPRRGTQTCPICQHVFPASSLNTDVNVHVDKCVERATGAG